MDSRLPAELAEELREVFGEGTYPRCMGGGDLQKFIQITGKYDDSSVADFAMTQAGHCLACRNCAALSDTEDTLKSVFESPTVGIELDTALMRQEKASRLAEGVEGRDYGDEG